MSLEHMLRDEAKVLALFLGEEFGTMEYQDFYEGLFLTMERSGQDFRTEQEKLEEDEAQEDRARCVECGTTVPLGAVIECYQQAIEPECLHSWLMYQFDGQYVLE